MKNFNRIAVTAIAALVAIPSYAADVSSSAGADIIAPLQITNSAALYFGTIAPSLTTADQVVVTSSGTRSCGSELTCVTADHTAAGFSVTGEADYVYNITLPTSISISNGGGGSMTVDTFTGSKASGTLVSGSDTFNVGGTLSVTANQPTGEYTGTFSVTVEYQ